MKTAQFKRFFLLLSICLLWVGINVTYGQDTLYTNRIEKIRRLVSIALLAKSCDSTLVFQEATIQAGLKQQLDTDSLLQISRQETKLLRLDLRDSTALLKLYLKEEKSKRKRNGIARDLFIVTTGILLWLLIKP